MDDLREALEMAVLDVLDGSPPGPLFASRVRRECVDVLRKKGLTGTVDVMDGGQRVLVRIRRGTRVETVVVSVARI